MAEAGKDDGKKEGKGTIPKENKYKIGTRQTTLENVVQKKVTFKDTEIINLTEEVNKLKEQSKKLKEKVTKDSKAWDKELAEIAKGMREQKEEAKEWKEKYEKLEEKVESLEENVKELEEKSKRALEVPAESLETSTDLQSVGEADRFGGSTWSLESTLSRKNGRSDRSEGRSVYSWGSGASEGFTGKEVTLMKKLLQDKDRGERACNVVFRGVHDIVQEIENDKEKKKDIKGWIESFTETRMNVKVKVIEARVCGGREKLIVAKMESVEDKRKIMSNKSKLKGSKIYIEHDLSYEERRRQDEIKKWCYERKKRGWKVKIGIGRVCVDEEWLKWEDKEKLRSVENEECRREWIASKEKEERDRRRGEISNEENTDRNREEKNFE